MSSICHVVVVKHVVQNRGHMTVEPEQSARTALKRRASNGKRASAGEEATVDLPVDLIIL